MNEFFMLLTVKLWNQKQIYRHQHSENFCVKIHSKFMLKFSFTQFLLEIIRHKILLS